MNEDYIDLASAIKIFRYRYKSIYHQDITYAEIATLFLNHGMGNKDNVFLKSRTKGFSHVSSIGNPVDRDLYKISKYHNILSKNIYWKWDWFNAQMELIDPCNSVGDTATTPIVEEPEKEAELPEPVDIKIEHHESKSNFIEQKLELIESKSNVTQIQHNYFVRNSAIIIDPTKTEAQQCGLVLPTPLETTEPLREATQPIQSDGLQEESVPPTLVETEEQQCEPIPPETAKAEEQSKKTDEEDCLYLEILVAHAAHEAVTDPKCVCAGRISINAIADKWASQFDVMANSPNSSVQDFNLHGLSARTIREKLTTALKKSKNHPLRIKKLPK